MAIRFLRRSAILALAAGLVISGFQAAGAQAPEQGMAMTLLPVIHEGSAQFIITPRGYKVQVPGTGLAKDANQVAVYQDSARNFWYINKHGQPTEVPMQVMQSVFAQIQAQGGSVPMGMAPGGGQPYQQPPVQQTTVIEQPSNSGSGSSALLGAAGAFAGAATGAALTNSSQYYAHPYYGVPYGTPVYRGGTAAVANTANHSGNSYYYYNNGQKQYINADNNNSKLFAQYDKQGEWKDRDQWGRNLQQTAADSEKHGLRGRFGGDAELGAGRFGDGGFRRRHR